MATTRNCVNLDSNTRRLGGKFHLRRRISTGWVVANTVTGWLHCQLPQGQVRLTDLKLTHPEVIPNRDGIAAPVRLASWIRFETLMASEGAISMLVSNLHQLCVAGQEIVSMEEAQSLLLRISE